MLLLKGLATQDWVSAKTGTVMDSSPILPNSGGQSSWGRLAGRNRATLACPAENLR